MREDIASLVSPTATSLAGWYTSLFALVFGDYPTPTTSAQLAYNYPVATGPASAGDNQSVWVTTPVVMTRAVAIDNNAQPPPQAVTPALFAQGLATPFIDWLAAHAADRTTTRATLDVKLYSRVADNGPVLLDLPNLRLNLTEIGS